MQGLISLPRSSLSCRSPYYALREGRDNNRFVGLRCISTLTRDRTNHGRKALHRASWLGSCSIRRLQAASRNGSAVTCCVASCPKASRNRLPLHHRIDACKHNVRDVEMNKKTPARAQWFVRDALDPSSTSARVTSAWSANLRRKHIRIATEYIHHHDAPTLSLKIEARCP